MAYVIKQDICSGCHTCELYCPMEAISMNFSKYWIDPDKCISCGHCAEVCHNSVITNPDAPAAEAVPHEKIVKTCDVLVIGGGAAGMAAAALGMPTCSVPSGLYGMRRRGSPIPGRSSTTSS